MINKKTVKAAAAGVAVGIGVGIVVAVVYYSNNTHMLKSAQWTDKGDMLLRFYHQSDSILLPKPV